MSRREFLEKVIIGTQLESGWRNNYFDDVRCSVTEEMFLDEVNRRIFRIISEMNSKGQTETDPCSILEVYGNEVLDILPAMLDLVVDYSFIHLKTDYNERQFIASCVLGTESRRTDVGFVDYVKQFITIVYQEDEGKRSEDKRSKVTAA